MATDNTATGIVNVRQTILTVLLVLFVLLALVFFWLYGTAERNEEVVPTPYLGPPIENRPLIIQPNYIELAPFLVNLLSQDEFGPRYLQTDIVLEVADESLQTMLKLLKPRIRNRIVLILSNKRAVNLATAQDKITLAQEIQADLNKQLSSYTKSRMPASTAKLAIEAVLFTTFVVQ